MRVALRDKRSVAQPIVERKSIATTIRCKQAQRGLSLPSN
jgi:hypothetical protein